MRFRVLGCSGGSTIGRFPTSFLIGDSVALDGGALTTALHAEDQRKIEHVVLSHAHLDHVGTLPFLLDNRFPDQTHPITLHAGQVTMEDLKSGLFNNRIWPDFTNLRTKKSVSLELATIGPGDPFPVGPLTVTANAMRHPVPCFGFLCDDGETAIYVAGDTGSCQPVVEATSRRDDLAAIAIEVSWPDRLRDLADLTGHLCPAHIAEAWPIHPTARVLITHIKPFFHDEVVAELNALGLDLTILEDGMSFDF